MIDLCSTLVSLKTNLNTLEKVTQEAASLTDAFDQAVYDRDVVFKAMAALRIDGDKLETIIDSELWPLPTYAEMLFML